MSYVPDAQSSGIESWYGGGVHDEYVCLRSIGSNSAVPSLDIVAYGLETVGSKISEPAILRVLPVGDVALTYAVTVMLVETGVPANSGGSGSSEGAVIVKFCSTHIPLLVIQAWKVQTPDILTATTDAAVPVFGYSLSGLDCECIIPFWDHYCNLYCN